MSLQKRKILHEAEYFPHYYLCTYVPRAAGVDRLSQSLLNFKNGISPHQQAWTECAAEELKVIQELRDAYVIRAFGHDEQTHRSKQMRGNGMLASKIANSIKGMNVSNFLEKTRDVKKLSTLNKEERETELYGAYRFIPPERDTKHILIVDDIYTTGATMRSLMTAVLKATPSVKISIFTLACTLRDITGNANVSLKGTTYEWQPNEGWLVAAEDSPEYASTLARIKRAIMNDLFF